MEPLLSILTKRDQEDIVKDQTKEIEENHTTDKGENNEWWNNINGPTHKRI